MTNKRIYTISIEVLDWHYIRERRPESRFNPRLFAGTVNVAVNGTPAGRVGVEMSDSEVEVGLPLTKDYSDNGDAKWAKMLLEPMEDAINAAHTRLWVSGCELLRTQAAAAIAEFEEALRNDD